MARDELNHLSRKKAWTCNAAASKLTASDMSLIMLACHDSVAADGRNALESSMESLRWDLQHRHASARIKEAGHDTLILARAASL